MVHLVKNIHEKRPQFYNIKPAGSPEGGSPLEHSRDWNSSFRGFPESRRKITKQPAGCAFRVGSCILFYSVPFIRYFFSPWWTPFALVFQMVTTCPLLHRNYLAVDRQFSLALCEQLTQSGKAFALETGLS